MKCKVCGKPIEKHDSKDLDTCLREGFGTILEMAHDAIAPYKIVVGKSQPHPDKSRFRLVLADGTVIDTTNVNEEYARLLLTKCYTKEQDFVEPSPDGMAKYDDTPVRDTDPDLKGLLEQPEDN